MKKFFVFVLIFIAVAAILIGAVYLHEYFVKATRFMVANWFKNDKDMFSVVTIAVTSTLVAAVVAIRTKKTKRKW